MESQYDIFCDKYLTPPQVFSFKFGKIFLFSFVWVWSHSLNKSLMENFILYAVLNKTMRD